MGDKDTSDIKGATDYLISSLQHEETLMMNITFPLLVLFSNIMMCYADEHITSYKHTKVQEIYVKLLHSMTDAHRYTYADRTKWTFKKDVETLWIAAYFTGYINRGEKGSTIYKDYSGALIKFCSENECEQVMTTFLDKVSHLKNDKSRYYQFSLFDDFQYEDETQRKTFMHNLYDACIAGSVALLAYETLTNGTEGVENLQNSIGHRMEGLEFWYGQTTTNERLSRLLSSKLNVLSRNQVCENAQHYTLHSSPEQTFCLCYEMLSVSRTM